MIQKIKASYFRKKQRRIVKSRTKELFNKILDAPIQHNGTTCLHQIDERNAGDFYSGPYHYFDSLTSKTSILQYLEGEEKRNSFQSSLSSDQLIVGGGGLFNRPSFKDVMSLVEVMSKKGRKIVIWGAGHNVPTSTLHIPKNYSIKLDHFALVGTRDKSMPGDYVPCVSCLHPLLDDTYEVNQELGVVFHKKTIEQPDVTQKLAGIPFLSNASSIEEIIPFIGQSESLITDSYHAMYWGLLLEKKVTVIPNSSKFFDFHVKPNFSDFDSCAKEYVKAVSTSGLLEECRELNKRFYEKTMNVLNV